MGGNSLPYSKEAEIAVLSAMLADEGTQARALESLDRTDFFKNQHRVVFKAMRSVYQNGQVADVVTLADYLGDKGHLERAGGIEYLSKLVEYAPSPERTKGHVEIVQNKATQRRLIGAARQILQDAEGASYDEVPRLLETAEQEVFDVADARVVRGAKGISEILPSTFREIEQRIEEGEVPGVKTGFSRLDSMTSGLKPGNYVVIAARPSMGKTALAGNIVTNAALKHDVAAGIFSLEMTEGELVERMVSSVAQVDSQKIRTGDLSGKEKEKIGEAGRTLNTAPIYIDDTPGLTPLQLRAKARRMSREHGVEMLVLDYLQLMHASKDYGNREREIASISQTIKELAKELDLPIICCSQLNRGPEAREDKRPVLADLRESGSIEQDADIVIFIYRDEVYTNQNQGKAEIIVGKQRNGPTGVITLRFDKKYITFRG